MRILVVGAGATGGYFGAKLERAGRDVTFLVREGRAATLRERGLRLTGLDDIAITPELVTAGEIDGPYDLILLSVKATALEQAIDDLAPAVGPATTIVPFLNGMAHIDRLNARFGAESVLGGVVMVATTVNGDGDVVRLVDMGSITVGQQDGTSSDRLRDVENTLSGVGFDLVVAKDVMAAMWAKWVFITTVGGLTCLMRGTVGEVVAVPGGAALGPAIAAEGASIAAAAGFPLSDGQMANVDATVTAVGSPTTSSLYRDVVAGQRTEGEHLFGDLVRRARQFGVGTPLLDLVTMQLRVHEHRIAAGAHRR